VFANMFGIVRVKIETIASTGKNVSKILRGTYVHRQVTFAFFWQDLYPSRGFLMHFSEKPIS